MASKRPIYLLPAAVVAAALFGGCGGGSAPSDGAEGSSSTCSGAGICLAFASSFKDFHKWQSTPGVPMANAPEDSVVHIQGSLTSYINKAPASGSTSFPIGTIIVKEQNEGDLPDRKIFAMVKRGGGFNSGTNGAVDWEFFELQNVDDSNVAIVWQGFGPPLGEAYGGDPGACNTCHAQAAYNDFVWTDGFTLSKF